MPQNGVIGVPDRPLAQRATPSMVQVVQAGFIRNTFCDLIDDPVFQAQSANARLTVLPRSVANILPGEVVFRPIAEITAFYDQIRGDLSRMGKT